MRSAVLLTWAAASAWANAAWSGVTLTGGGWHLTTGQLADAMDLIEGKGDHGSHYLVHASTVKHQPFVQPPNSTLTWGNSPGMLWIAGDLSAAGRLLFEVAGRSSPPDAVHAGVQQHDMLFASGDVHLLDGASLAFLVSPGIEFTHGDSFTLIVTGDGHSIVTDLDVLRATLSGLPALPDGNSWRLQIAPGGFEGYGGDSLVLMVVPMPGPAAIFAMAALTGARRRRR